MGSSAPELIGRDADISFVGAFVDGAAVHGGALLVSGDAGVGKTALLDAAAARAQSAGTRIVRAVGAEFEAEVSFAGLSHVLHTILDEGLERLSPLYRQALGVALGVEVGQAADRLVLTNAVLALLRDAAATRPLLIIVDDLPWMDRASSLVLASAARRLANTRVGFLAALRTDEKSFFDRAGLPSYELGPLSDDAAASLVSNRFPALAPRVRDRLVAEAMGNPLALLELPIALEVTRPTRREPREPLPLTARLQDLFASRIRGLPAPTFALLLIAALDGTGDLRVLEAVAPDDPGLDDLAAAERQGIIEVDTTASHITFRHPLIRSAVVALSTSDQRRRAHRELAERVSVRERRAWHLAEATVGPDESVASNLEEFARTHLNRGDAVRAVALMSRAAELSPATADRGSRMAEAVYIGANFLGELGVAPDLLDAMRRNDPEHAGSLAGAMAVAYHLLNGEGEVDTAHQLLVGAIQTAADPSDASDEVLLEAIYNLLEICHYGGRAELWAPFDHAVARLQPRPPEGLAILAAIASDPARRAVPMLGRLEGAIARLNPQSSPTQVIRLCIAAAPGERLGQCRPALQRLVDQGRDGGTIAYSIQALVLLTRHAYLTGEWDEAQELADEGVRLCEAHDHALLRWPHRAQQALLAAARGDRETTSAITDEVLQWAAPRRARQMQIRALHARELDSLAAGDFERAYHDLVEISPAGTIAPFLPHAMWVVMDLVEAAVRTGRRDEALAHVKAARDADLGKIAPRLGLLTEGAAGMAAIELDGSFERALALPDAHRWTFDLARVALAYGERLRRVKDIKEARAHLSSALSSFQRLGALPWARRAADELRATGATSGQTNLGPVSLTAQEREIAQLAATGLSNKEIGERLYLSHRTVGTHLYHLFPKLGITSRAALRDALDGETSEQ